MQTKFSLALQKLNPTLLDYKGERHAQFQGFWQILGAEMEPSSVVALREHLLNTAELPPLVRPISSSHKTWIQARGGFKRLQSEMDGRLLSFKDKWKQRWQLDVVKPILAQNPIIEQTTKGYKFKGSAGTRDAQNISKVLIHEMLKDLEKELIFIESRLKSLQDLVLKDWYAQALRSPEDRILPTLENALRPAENHFVRKSRESFYAICESSFQLRLKKHGFKEQVTLAQLLAHIGVLSAGRLYPHFLSDTTDLAKTICLEWLDWHLAKWALFLRGCKIQLTKDIQHEI